jgi:peptidoglycan/xylan/chitin deacetylase (PgdA/CDA1 family)
VRAILTYHSIDDSGSVISVPPPTFERQVRWLTASDVAVVPLGDLLRLPDDTDAVAITFDDAYTNFATEAWPRLEEHGLPATVFVPTGFVGQANTWAALPGGGMPPLPILGWDALARLAERGVGLGGHTRTHPDLRRLEDAAIRDEICGASDELLRQTGMRPRAFAYPYGFSPPAAVSIARTAYECAVTTELRPMRQSDDPYLLPRLDTFYLNGIARIENFGGLSFREYLRLRLRLRALAQRVRAAVATGA